YGAAGQVGVWNTITTPTPWVPTTHPLVGLDGRELQATVTIMNNDDGGLNDSGTSGADEQLFDDGLWGLGDVVSFVTFDGLAPGTYEVIVYALTPTIPTDITTIMIDEDFNSWESAGGAWPGEPEEGVTHAVVTGETTEDGTLVVQYFGGIIATMGFVNGIQLVRVEPANFDPADLDQDGAVGFSDLLILFSQWSTPGHGCNGILQCIGDLNGDQVIDFADLLILIGAWSI
ncbi:MAG: hypothetical protein ACYTGP_10825, partial [Planctomycetota bacterium]